MTANDKYWQGRFETLEASRHSESVEAVKEVVRHLTSAEKSIIQMIEAWYARYADMQGISYAEAKKRLSPKELTSFKMSVDEYIRIASDFEEAQKWQRQLKDISADTGYYWSYNNTLNIVIVKKDVIYKIYLLGEPINKDMMVEELNEL